MRILRIALSVGLLAVLAAAGFVWHSQQPVIAKNREPPPRSAFNPALIAQGARLAAIGNCRACHTAQGSAEADYAGNRPIPTPFGTIYSSNITPAPGSGIGRWSEAAFRRAMRDGVSRTGAHLYPAFPYDHFARLGDDDLHALYAFLMTRRPVDSYQQPSTLPFPLNQRWLLSFWNALFFWPVRFTADDEHSAQWNRGAYLVEGLGHCGDCHTPRNFLGAEEHGHALDGGSGGGWTAPALDAASPAPVPWDAAQLFNYLRFGWDAKHGAAAGPMQTVAADLAQADPADVRAIAVYIAAQEEGARAERAPSAASQSGPPQHGPAEEVGAALFAGACARCHMGGGAEKQTAASRGIDLALSTVVSDSDPRDAILIVLNGIMPSPAERPGPFMPGFTGSLDDGQIAALLAFVRAHYGDAPAWPYLERRIRELRHRDGPA